ncbi:MAG TPA: hypothetical protein DDY22_09250 [Geobacter sp.]|nr:hypothetical protein [Geobacter sp.]
MASQFLKALAVTAAVTALASVTSTLKK